MKVAPARLRAFIHSLRVSRDVLGSGLLLLMLTYGVSTAALGLFDRSALFFVERFHLKTTSFLVWAAWVPSPWMYNFENRFLYSPIRLSAQQRVQPPPGLAWRYINHYPSRVMTFAEHRLGLTNAADVLYVYIDSRYRDVTVTSAFRMDARAARGSAAESVHLERVALDP